MYVCIASGEHLYCKHRAFRSAANSQTKKINLVVSNYVHWLVRSFHIFT